MVNARRQSSSKYGFMSAFIHSIAHVPCLPQKQEGILGRRLGESSNQIKELQRQQQDDVPANIAAIQDAFNVRNVHLLLVQGINSVVLQEAKAAKDATLQQSAQVMADKIRLEKQMEEEEGELNEIRARLNEFDQKRETITVVPTFVSNWLKRRTNLIQGSGSGCRCKTRASAEGTFTSSTAK